MNRAEEMLARSTACYREILDLYGQIKTDVAKGTSANVINMRLEKLKELFSQTEKINADFEEEAEKSGGVGDGNPCLLDWRDAVAAVLEENGRMRKYLQSAMAVTKHEMESLGAAKKALGGYRSPVAAFSTGTRINIHSG